MSVKEIIEPGKSYHLYNHANGNMQLFRSEDNYKYFLLKYQQYVHPFVDTFAYCLMPNHFHFALRIKENSSELSESSELLRRKVTNAIKNWLISYTQAYNKAYSNRGNLYHQKIRRKQITDQKYLLQLIGYIHLNPIMHGFAVNLKDWKFSSYSAFLCNKGTLLKRDEILTCFDDKDNFEYYHDRRMAEKFAQENSMGF